MGNCMGGNKTSQNNKPSFLKNSLFDYNKEKVLFWLYKHAFTFSSQCKQRVYHIAIGAPTNIATRARNFLWSSSIGGSTCSYGFLTYIFQLQQKLLTKEISANKSNNLRAGERVFLKSAEKIKLQNMFSKNSGFVSPFIYEKLV